MLKIIFFKTIYHLIMDSSAKYRLHVCSIDSKAKLVCRLYTTLKNVI